MVPRASRRLFAITIQAAPGGSRLRPFLLVGSLVLVFAAGARVASARQERQQPALLTGADWKAFGSREKEAYLNGFLAGAAAEQAQTAAATSGVPADSAAVSSAAIARLKSAKQLQFPYAPSVYAVQVDDYYWWTDHLGTPLVDVMISVNRQMLKP